MTRRNNSATDHDERASAELWNRKVSTAEMAEVLGISPRWYRRLAAQGILPKSEAGRVEFGPACAAYLRHVEAKAKPSPEALAEERRLDAQARLLEQATGERDAELIAVDEHHAILDEIITEAKAVFATLPDEAGLTGADRDRLAAMIAAGLDRALARATA